MNIMRWVLLLFSVGMAIATTRVGRRNGKKNVNKGMEKKAFSTGVVKGRKLFWFYKNQYKQCRESQCDCYDGGQLQSIVKDAHHEGSGDNCYLRWYGWWCDQINNMNERYTIIVKNGLTIDNKYQDWYDLDAFPNAYEFNGAKVTIIGEGNRQQIKVLDYKSHLRVMLITSGSVRLENLEITGGDIVGHGAGIYVTGGTLDIVNCKIYKNEANEKVAWVPGTGGGLYMEGGTVTMTNCLVTENKAEITGGGGGGIYIYGGTLKMEGCEVKGNEPDGVKYEKGDFSATSTTFQRPCPKGSSIEQDLICRECAAGKYQDHKSYSDRCRPCPKGSYSGSGQGTSSQCITCPKGKFSPTEAEECTICEAGKYAASERSSSCNSCPSGKYSNEVSSTCFNCPAGSYSNLGQGKSSLCTKCPAGFYSEEGEGEGSRHVLGVGGLRTCPSSSSPLVDQSSCEEASKEMGINFDKSTNSEKYPYGCLKVGNNTFWNSASNGMGHQGTQLVCHQQSPCSPCPAGSHARFGEGINSTCSLCPMNTFSTGGINSTDCTKCLTGKFADEGTGKTSDCHTCAPGRYTHGSGVCLDCAPGKYSEMESSSECKPCRAGHFGASSQMTVPQCSGKCDVGKYSIEGAFQCTACPPGKLSPFGSDSQDKCQHLCYPGFWTDSSDDCNPCAVGKYSDDVGILRADDCKGCVPGKYGDKLGLIFCELCPVAKFSNETNSTICKECPVGKIAYRGSPKCLDCMPGLEASDGQDICTPCKPGHFRSGNDMVSCRECEAGKYALEGSSSCIECPPGRYGTFFLSDKNSINCGGECNPGKYGLGGSTSANCDGECPSGSFSTGGASATSCSLCEFGKFQNNTGATYCTSCLAGKYSLKGYAICNDCSPGRYSNVSGSVACTQECDAGKYGLGGSNSSDCDGDCPAGSYSVGGAMTETCTLCKAGRFNPETGASECVSVCERGKFAAAGAITCTQCPAGRTGFFIGARSDNDCIRAPPGKYADGKNVTHAQPCPKGTYQIEYGQLTCKLCPSGKYGNVIGATSERNCTNCPQNTYSSATGIDSPSKCNACPVGKSSTTPGLTSADACLACGVGKFGTGNGTFDCGKGTYQDETGKTTCKPCPSGKYGNTMGLKTKNCSGLCNKGKFSVTRAVACTQCPAGRIGPSLGASSENDCIETPLGKYADGKNFVQAQPCPKGTYQDTTGQLTCKACLPGKYGDSSGLKTSNCSGLCPSGSRSAIEAKVCTPCEAGKFSSQAGQEICQKCQADQTSFENATSCVCTKNHFMNKNSSCVRCMTGVDCSHIGNTIKNLQLKTDYWRENDNSIDIFPCPMRGACDVTKNRTNQTNSSKSMCAVGNQGPLCAICSGNYYHLSTSAKCQECGTPTESLGFLVLGLFIGTFGLFVVFLFNSKAGSGGIMRSAINFLQYVSVMLAFEVDWPPSLKVLSEFLNGVSVEFLNFSYSSPKCLNLVPMNYYRTFTAMVLLIVSVSLFLFVWAYWYVNRNLNERLGPNGKSTFWDEFKGNYLRNEFIFLLLVYPVSSGEALSLFRCKLIGGDYYLMADYSIKCYTPEWWQFSLFVWSFLFIFTLGLPLGVALHLKHNESKLTDDHFRTLFDVFYGLYRPETYWFETVTMLFKLALWSNLVFFPQKSEMQLSTALVINIMNFGILCFLQPYKKYDINILQIGVLIITSALNFTGLVLSHLELSTKYNDHVTKSKSKAISLASMTRSTTTIIEVFTFMWISIMSGYALHKVLPTIWRKGKKAMMKTTTFKKKKNNNQVFNKLSSIEKKLIISVVNNPWRRSERRDTSLISYRKEKIESKRQGLSSRLGRSRGISISSNEIFTYKIEFMINAPLGEVYKFLTTRYDLNEYPPNTYHDTLEKLSDKHTCWFQYRVYKSKVPFLSDRLVALERHCVLLEDHGIGIVAVSSNPRALNLVPNRIKHSVVAAHVDSAGYIIERWKDENDEEITKITYSFNIDVRGWVPTKVNEYLSHRELDSKLERISNHFSKEPFHKEEHENFISPSQQLFGGCNVELSKSKSHKSNISNTLFSLFPNPLRNTKEDSSKEKEIELHSNLPHKKLTLKKSSDVQLQVVRPSSSSASSLHSSSKSVHNPMQSRLHNRQQSHYL